MLLSNKLTLMSYFFKNNLQVRILNIQVLRILPLFALPIPTRVYLMMIMQQQLTPLTTCISQVKNLRYPVKASNFWGIASHDLLPPKVTLNKGKQNQLLISTRMHTNMRLMMKASSVAVVKYAHPTLIRSSTLTVNRKVPNKVQSS